MELESHYIERLVEGDSEWEDRTETCIDFVHKGAMPFGAYTVSSRTIEAHGISICLHSAVVGMLNTVAQHINARHPHAKAASKELLEDAEPIVSLA